ncbi:GAF domain-containing protein [Lysobacter korlensis]|uniref:GAF domain-containing protein n=1 Tax=Lysobacter korlensis TaxID=553636 RepID=A0ABV6RVG6_9GAMM
MSTIRQRSVVDRLWHAILDRSFLEVPRPTDAPFAHSTGSDPYRVLVFGSGTAMGWGARSHELALPGQLARELGDRTLRGVDVDLIADKCMTALSAIPALEGRLIAPYDAIVVSLGMTDSLRLLPARTFRARMRAVLTELSARTSSHARLVLLGMQPVQTIPLLENGGGRILDRHARRLDEVLQALGSEFPKARHVAMSAGGCASHRSATAEHYRVWAGEIAAHLAPMLAERAADVAPPFLDEPARLRAVRELEKGTSLTHGALDKIAELARSVFRADVATISLIDGERQRVLASAGMEVHELPRSASLSQYALGSRTAFVVSDTAADRRFRRMHATALGLRFYAGYPLHSPDGQPVGTLAVLAAEPRPREAVDVDLLRDIAMLAQRELRTRTAVSA